MNLAHPIGLVHLNPVAQWQGDSDEYFSIILLHNLDIKQKTQTIGRQSAVEVYISKIPQYQIYDMFLYKLNKVFSPYHGFTSELEGLM